jgi:L-iditol 2-dehydrogenase
MAMALEVAAFRARLVYIGINVGGVGPAALGLIQSKELEIRGTIGSPGVWQQTLAFLSRTKLDLSPMVTKRYPLSAADEAISTVISDHAQVKVHITSDARL